MGERRQPRHPNPLLKKHELKMTEVFIPTALHTSDRWSSLNPQQRSFLKSKLVMCAEMADRARVALSDTSTPLLELIDDNELDGISCMGAAGNVSTEVSPYQLHSSWTTDFDSLQMASHADEDVVAFLNTPRPQLTANQTEHRQWISDWGHQLSRTLTMFNASSQFAGAVTSLLMIDALVFIFLSYAPIARFSIAYPGN